MMSEFQEERNPACNVLFQSRLFIKQYLIQHAL